MSGHRSIDPFAILRILGRLLLLAVVAVLAMLMARSEEMPVRLRASSGDEPLRRDVTVVADAVGERVRIGRLDLLLSDFRFVLEDGSEVRSTTRAAFVGLGGAPESFFLRDRPRGPIRSVRFRVGLTPELDRVDVATLASDDPLNPSVNRLHWGWLGGYVFLALEGNGRTASGVEEGFSFHLAGPAAAMPVELPYVAGPGGDGAQDWILDVARVLGAVPGARLGASTHSRADDPLVRDLIRAVPGAFRIAKGPAVGESVASTVRPASSEVDVASTATPYRFPVPVGFPIPTLPRDNPLTVEGVELGRRLFHEPLLSLGGRQSCASCHSAQDAFVDAGRRFSRGAEGKEGARNTMPLANLAWQGPYFWDGRATSLREQVLMPIANPVEMHESPGEAVRKLEEAGYGPAFGKAFGTGVVTVDRLARALEQFLLAQVSADSKFDRVGRGEAEFTALERRGFELFFTEHDPRRERYGADCFHCHGGPLFTDSAFHSNGLDAEGAWPDDGRGKVTANGADRGRFRTPSLRNVARTAPYMHDGRFATLDEAVAHYCTGVKRAANLDPNLAKHPDGGVGLDTADQQALVAFLRTLSDLR